MKTKRPSTLAIIVLMQFILLFTLANAQLVQQGDKLIGTGAIGAAYQGYAVALSADGSTAIIGGAYDDGNAGAAWVYTRSGGVWNQQGGKLTGGGAVGAAWLGTSVALSADGNTAIVGGWADNSQAGAAWIYARSGGVWMQQGAKLVGTGASGNANQGISVALSADGNTAIVGGDRDNANAGAVWVFVRSAGVWTQQGAKLVGTGAVGNAYQGHAVSLSGDGNTAIVGGYVDAGGIGASWIFSRSGGTWSQVGGKLVGTGTTWEYESQGVAVALSADGATAVVGGNGDSSYVGAAWIFAKSGGVWTQQGTKLVGADAVGMSHQGIAVSISGDGNRALVGGFFDDGGAGGGWVFARSGGLWTQEGGKLVGTGAVGVAYQGFAAALSADGGTAILGARGDDGQIGAAWVFAEPGAAEEDFWQPTAVTTIAALWSSPSGKLFHTNGQVIFRSTDNGESWDSIYTVAPSMFGGAVVKSNQHLFLATKDLGMFRSTDEGSTWTGISTGLTTGNTRLPTISPSGDIFIGSADGGVFRSTNEGDLWTSASSGIWESNIGSLAINAAGELFAGVKGSNGIFKSTDNGASWSITSMPTSCRVYSLAVHPASSHIFAGTQYDPPNAPNPDGIYKSIDAGGRWVQSGLPGQSISTPVIFPPDQSMMVGTESIGVYRSTDGGATWDSVNSGLPSPRRIVTLTYANGYVFAGTFSGIFRSVKMITAGVDDPLRTLPAGFSLKQNYPNPFNPVTIIDYALPTATHVTLTVTNLLGERVATLVSGVEHAGYRSVSFDGSGLPSGVYICTMTAGGVSSMQKMLLLR